MVGQYWTLYLDQPEAVLVLMDHVPESDWLAVESDWLVALVV